MTARDCLFIIMLVGWSLFFFTFPPCSFTRSLALPLFLSFFWLFLFNCVSRLRNIEFKQLIWLLLLLLLLFAVSLFVVLSDGLLLWTHLIVVQTFDPFVIINCNIFVPLIVIAINLWLSKLSPHQIRVLQSNDIHKMIYSENKEKSTKSMEIIGPIVQLNYNDHCKYGSALFTQ